jgi:hypothetical protein
MTRELRMRESDSYHDEQEHLMRIAEDCQKHCEDAWFARSGDYPGGGCDACPYDIKYYTRGDDRKAELLFMWVRSNRLHYKKAHERYIEEHKHDGVGSCIILVLLFAGLGWVIYQCANGWPAAITHEQREAAQRAISTRQQSAIAVPSSEFKNRDKYGLLASDYDVNGWAKVNGRWVSNPRANASVRYSARQIIATSSNKISVIENYSEAKPYRNFYSISETYHILERVAGDLQYSDIPALYDSFNKWEPLTAGWYYNYNGKKFYSQQALFDYKIQQAKSWGSKNDQNGDGEINCSDYAELFYKYALEEGYHVRYIINNKLNHAFNGVNVNGSWITIEPQAAESGLDRSPLMSIRWTNYYPSYDVIKKQL